MAWSSAARRWHVITGTSPANGTWQNGARMRTFLLCLALALVGCGKRAEKPAPAPATPDAAAAAPKPVAVAPVADAAVAAPLAARAGGPSVDDCNRAADHLKSLVVNSVPGATAGERAYVGQLIDEDRAKVVRYCLEIAVPKEIACVMAAKEAEKLAGCERLRRDIPESLATARELTEADCARFFDRLRQFKLAEGVKPAEIDRDRDQIIRSCQEKAKPGTVACFIASPTYEQARRCP